MLSYLLVIARALQIGASMLFFGILTFEIVALRSAVRLSSAEWNAFKRALLGLAGWAVVAVFLSAFFWFWLVVASMTGISLTDLISTNAWRTVLFETKFGRVWQARIGLIGIAFLLVYTDWRHDGPSLFRHWRLALLWLLSLGVLVSLSWVSHAAAAEAQPIGVFGDMIHLCAAGAWIGGLVPTAIFLARDKDLGSPGNNILLVVNRFSTLSLCCVGLLMLGGVSNAWLLVGSLDALVTTRYGLLVLSKVALLAVLIGFGFRNRSAIRKMSRAPSLIQDLSWRLRSNIIWEACLGLVIVAIVAWLGVTPPARHP